MNLRTFLSALALAGTVAACGGGSDHAEAPVADDMAVVPASATASVAAFTAFVAEAPPDDTREPLALGSAVPPTSDDDEPASVVR